MTNIQSLVDFIKKLKNEHRLKLYTSSLFCVSILKLIDKSTTSLIFDLLINAPTIKTLQNNKNVKESLKLLVNLGLVEKKGLNIYLNSVFKNSLLTGVCEINRDIFFEKSKLKNIQKITENNEILEILKFITTKQTNKKHFGVFEILLYGKLINKTGDITNIGFEFLLKSRNEQIWSLIILGLLKFTLSVDDQIDTLISLLELSFKKPNVTYKILKPINMQFYTFLQSLGLLIITKESLDSNDLTFTLTFNDLFWDIFLSLKTNSSSFIMIETNFKLYAYTNSDYEISIIKLFSEIQLELPNLVKAMITEESVNNAFEKGVTSSQIIHFLTSSFYKGELPVTISNQIKIWEAKRNRIQTHFGYLYSNFLNLIDFQKVHKFCLEKNCIIDKDIEKRVLIIKPEFNEIVKKYVETILKQP
ncbi:General transcription factor IIH subunit 4 [Nosema bombycis CQ1]|uniref:RNA polymerase II transcription factor B subunit 2 n=1 Tax=Nosema bombycis (strain CQ1 / CVCC 102059) TaxID=578461 RepID=R0MJL7_NOSB1|nr:General transcription factor IIH subunit 4 [Nosema bombycis CQ1]|eukprot:EOB14385.1 General transcription factor IIH subunit 4 [Nosema bombycis CQ1]